MTETRMSKVKTLRASSIKKTATDLRILTQVHIEESYKSHANCIFGMESDTVCANPKRFEG
jgi:hypothetical protein